MSRLREMLLRFCAIFKKRNLDRDLEEELQGHFEMLVEENRRRGMNEFEAGREARISLGGVEQIKEAHREQRGLSFLETVWQDSRYAVRQMRRSPTFTLVAVLTIGLGIGVNAGIFSILDAMVLQPIKMRGSGRLVSVYPIFQGSRHRNTRNSENLFSYAEYKTYRDESHVFSGLAGYVPFVGATAGGERPAEVYGSLASCNYFDVLNQRPSLGRGFVESDCAAARASAVVVLSDEYWRSERGADPQIVGKTISLNHTSFIIIGVGPPGFDGTEILPSAFWVPITMQPALITDHGLLNDAELSWIAIIGRLRAGISVEQGRADLGVITSRLNTENKETMKLSVQPAALFNRPEERGAILTVGSVVLIAVGLVLLIACANIANLLLARAAGRRREIAVRLAVGASRGRLIRQLLTESLLLALIGGTLGTLVSFATIDQLVRLVVVHLPPGAPPITLHLSPDARVLGYSLTLTILAGITFGLAPALQSSRTDLNAAIKDETGDVGGLSGRAGALRSILVSGQVAVCMVLLLTAGLLLHGLYDAQNIDPGFEIKGLDAVTFRLESQGYSKAQAAVLHQQMKERLKALPGVDAVIDVNLIPLGDEHWGTVAQVPGSGVEKPASLNRVSPNFFVTAGIPIVRGRGFTEEDVQTGVKVVVVTEEAARRFWPGADPIGKILQLQGEANVPEEVVGVAKDAQVDHLGERSPNFLYLPTSLKDEPSDQFIVHGTLSDAATVREIREAILAIDPSISFAVARMEDNLEIFRAPSRIVSVFSGTLAGLALLMACIGIYGLVSFSVSRRIREIGIRMALGANRRDVMRLILEQVLRPVVIGALVGMACCAGVSRIFSSLLFGVSPLDPVSFVLVPLLLTGVAALASYLPARRAMKVDPVVALRYE